LQLAFKKANDETLKKHLAIRIQDIKSASGDQRQQLDQLHRTTQELTQERTQLVGDLQQAREECRRVQDAMQIDQQKALNALREKMLLEQAEMQSKHENEVKDSRKRHDTAMAETQTKLSQTSQ